MYRLAIVVHNAHTACYRSACQCLSDASHTNDTQSLTIERMAEVIHHAKGFGFAFSKLAVKLHCATCHIVHEGKSQFGSRFDDWLWGIGYTNTAFATCLKVDIIEAHTEVRY